MCRTLTGSYEPIITYIESIHLGIFEMLLLVGFLASPQESCNTESREFTSYTSYEHEPSIFYPIKGSLNPPSSFSKHVHFHTWIVT
jgi:hypothetical protein